MTLMLYLAITTLTASVQSKSKLQRRNIFVGNQIHQGTNFALDPSIVLA